MSKSVAFTRPGEAKGQGKGWTATLFQVVRKYFYTEESGTSRIARLSITNLDWVKVNGAIEHDDGRVIVPGDLVAFRFGDSSHSWVEKEMDEKLLEGCY